MKRKAFMAVSVIVVLLLGACLPWEPEEGTFEEREDILNDAVCSLQEYMQVHTPVVACSLVAEDLENYDLIRYADFSRVNNSVFWRTTDGFPYLVTTLFTENEDTTENPINFAPSSREYSQYSLPHNNDALILSPALFQWNIFFGYGDECEKIVEYLVDAGFDTTYKYNDDKDDQNITLDDYKHFDDFSVIVISGHGGYWEDEELVVIATGVRKTQELDTKYKEYFLSDKLVYFSSIVDKIKFLESGIGFTPKWVEEYYPEKLNNTVIYAGVCDGSYNQSMVNAMVGTGSGYFSWTGAQLKTWSKPIGEELFKQLTIFGTDCNEAYLKTCEKYGCEYEYPFQELPSWFVYDGHIDVFLVDPGSNEGLVAYYPFEGNANDESGYGNDGIVVGANYVSGYDGNALYFDGSDYVRIPSVGLLGALPGDAMTIEAWIKLDPTAPNRNAICERELAGGDDCWPWFLLTWDSRDLYGLVRSCTGGVLGPVLDLDTWYHVTLVFEMIDGQPIGTLYLNDTEVDQVVMEDRNSIGGDIFIGVALRTDVGYDHFQDYFHGIIDEVKIWNVARHPL